MLIKKKKSLSVAAAKAGMDEETVRKNIEDFEWSSHIGYITKSKKWDWL